MKNDRRVREAATYHSVAMGSADDERGGRYADSGNSTTVTGSSPISYPAQPPSSPWACDPLPPEPPLGFAIDAMEPTGEKFEVAASIGGSPSTPAASAVEGEGGRSNRS